MINIKKLIGENIILLRMQRNLSIEELAEILDISPAFVGLIERGQRGASIKNIYKLSKIFNTSIDYFFKPEDEKEIFYDTKENKEIKIINTLLYDLDYKKIKFLIVIIKELRKIDINKIN